MPDISMCSNDECGKRMTCYRYRAKPSGWQSYAKFSPDEHGHCTYYWSAQGYEDRIVSIEELKKRKVGK